MHFAWTPEQEAYRARIKAFVATMIPDDWFYTTGLHGKASPVRHDGKGIFAGLPQDFEAGRYHSLAALSVPDVFEVSATGKTGGVALLTLAQKMQTDLGVTADGIYGAETHNALKGKGDSIVASLQTALTEYGYYTGPIDGSYGQATQDAVKALQADLGVTQDGKFGPETAKAFDQAVVDGTITPKTS